MEKRTIGTTGLQVTALGFGCGPIAGLYAPVPDAGATAALCAARDAGIGYFDAAPLYGSGLAERRLGDALRHDFENIVVSTKVGRLLKPSRADENPMFHGALPFKISYDYSYGGVMRSIEDSWQRMGTAGIDILYIHDVNRKWHGDAVEDRFREVMEGGYRALEELRAAGIVKAIGVGVNDPDILVRFANAGDFDCFMLAGRYTLLEQTPLDELFPLCARKSISVVAAGPFNSGILASGAKPGAKYFYSDAPEAMLTKTAAIEVVCRRHSVPLAAAALQFALGHPVVASVATGMVSPEEVHANVEHLATTIAADFWLELKHEGLIRADTPTPTAQVCDAT
ncbi:MAG: aldo/keto reductase [Mesorhizobium sp.]